MAQKQTIKEISAQLRDPQHIDILRMLLKRYGKRLQVARLTVKDGYLHYAGTTGNMISYWWRDINCLRTKGTLNRKSFFKKKCFENSRKSAKRFALGNELASSLYARVMVSRKAYPLFCFLKKKAILLIKEGKTIEEAEEILIDYLQSFGLVKKQRRTKPAHTERLRLGGNEGRERPICGCADMQIGRGPQTRPSRVISKPVHLPKFENRNSGSFLVSIKPLPP